ncbi:hypothetical protein SKAU_G00085010 [Synaphobranchus kaupii]|uniref:Uncharacterized protein n=1 Tax=Synaphobranchus kaupii TaxID=118154 RepID=A0A9Q1FWE5_SYNKA|nr:hypothetical protein SKAU_G00085010 [Synaphobranchus kaupii]
MIPAAVTNGLSGGAGGEEAGVAGESSPTLTGRKCTSLLTRFLSGLTNGKERKERGGLMSLIKHTSKPPAPVAQRGASIARD